MPETVAVVGAGSWGTTLAALAADAGHAARIWSRRAEVAAEIDDAVAFAESSDPAPLDDGNGHLWADA